MLLWRHHRLLPICLYFMCTPMLWALNESESDTIARLYALDEVSIVAERRPAEVLPAQRLDGERLQELSAHSVADALRYFSGVQIKDYGGVGGIKTIDVRSMGSHHLGVFYDGLEVGNAQNGIVDLGKFSMDNIESLSLYNGQKTESLQSAKDFSSSGTLYIRTRRPQFEVNKNYNVTVGLKTGCFGLVNPSLLYEQQITDALHLSANVEYTYANGRYPFTIQKYFPDGSLAWDTTGYRQNGDIQAIRAEAGLFGYLRQGKWHVKGYYYQSDKGIPRAIIRNVWTSAQRQWDRNTFVQGDFQYHVLKRWELLAAIKYANDKMRYLNPDTTLMYVDNTFLQQEVYLSWANRVELFPWWDMTLSADYSYNTLASDMPNFAFPTRHTGLIAAAASFHYQWIQAQASVLGTFIHDQLGRENTITQAEASKQKPMFTPGLFVSGQPLLHEQWFIRAFYKQVFRMPTFNDLYYTDMGNIALKPEESQQYDISMDYSKEIKLNLASLTGVDVHAKADGYFNQVKNKIVAVPKGNSQYRWMMMNLGYVEIRGVDVNTGIRFHFAHDVLLDINGSYTYQRAQDFTDPDDALTYGGQIAYIPRHSCSAYANIKWKSLRMNYSFIYVGERYHSSANTPANYEQPWYTHDMALGYLWCIKKHFHIDTTLEINNILNQQYDIILNYPMPGIHGKLSIKFIM